MRWICVECWVHIKWNGNSKYSIVFQYSINFFYNIEERFSLFAKVFKNMNGGNFRNRIAIKLPWRFFKVH